MNEIAEGNAGLEQQPSSWSRLSWFCAGWLPAIAGVICLVALNVGLIGGPWARFLSVPAGLLAMWTGSIVIHEAGHWFTARVLKLNPYELSLGYGPLIWEGPALGLFWRIKAMPHTGWVRVWPTALPLLRWRMLLMVGAGPLTNALVGVLAAWLIYQPPLWWTQLAVEEKAFTILQPLLSVNAWFFVSSIYPHHWEANGVMTKSDGMQIVELLRGTHCTSPLTKGQTTTSSSGGSAQTIDHWTGWEQMMRAGNSAAFFHQIRQLLHQYTLPMEVRVQLLDQYATAVLMLEESSQLAEADRYSEELIRLRPAERTVKGTRGSVLVELGRLDEGTALLREVMDNDPSNLDGSISASYLGLSELKRGNRVAAEEWLDEARGFDPKCPLIERFEKVLAVKFQNASDGPAPQG